MCVEGPHCAVCGWMVPIELYVPGVILGHGHDRGLGGGIYEFVIRLMVCNFTYVL